MESLKKTSSSFTFLTQIPHHTIDLFLSCCGIQHCPPDYSYGPTVRMEYIIHLVLHGEGNLYINGKDYKLKQNQIFFIPPGIPAEYCSDSQDPWDYLWFGFHGENAFTYLKQTGLSLDSPVKTLQINQEYFVSIIKKMFETDRNVLTDELDRIGYLYELLSLLTDSYRMEKSEDNVNTLLSKKHTLLAIQYIEENYQNATVSTIADYLGLNRKYLHALFKREFNVSPQQYLIEFRLRTAAQELFTSDCSIQEIAFKVGYQDTFSFSKAFKKYFGISPSQYRESIRRFD